MTRHARYAASGLLLLCLAAAGTFGLTWAKSSRSSGDAQRVVHTVTPSQADPGVRDFDTPAYVTYNKSASDNAQLVLFLSGTNGHPRDRPLLRVVADQGYRTIDLPYNDEPAVNPVCRDQADADCSLHFRADRVRGDSKSEFTHTPPAETIVTRLAKTLQYLDKKYPDQHWGAYLAADGQPDWSRIVVSGLSQGAGMAAIIAKEHEVARVVLFSAPADFVLDDSAPIGSHPAPWLSMPSATPPERWYAEYHVKERGAERLKQSYAALKIPPDHISVFDLELGGAGRRHGDFGDGGEGGGGGNPYHGSTIRVSGYAAQWRAMYGVSP